MPESQRLAMAAELELKLSHGEAIDPEQIAELLASDDEELGLLASYLLGGHEEMAVARATTEAKPVFVERLARRHADQLEGRLDLPPRLRRAIGEARISIPAASAVVAAALPGAPVETMTLVIHGAFAAGDSWWRPTGSFGRYIGEITGNLYQGSDFFRWSGGGFHPARERAARDLVAWVRQHPAQELDIITHSHGGNIVFLATKMGLKVRKLISLATPMTLDYMPDLRQIGILHNVLSLGDIIQGPASFIGVHRRGDGRTLADNKRVINHLVTDNGRGDAPSHSELHEPATWRAAGLEALLLGLDSFPRRRE